MPTLQDVAGDTGIFTDGNWILSENMDANGKYGVIQLKHVGIGEFLGYKDFNFINEKTFNDLRCTEVLPGDVLISRMADPIGRACIVPQLPFPCVTAVDVTIVRIDKNIAEPEFIMHLCNSPSMREKIDRAVRGTTRARITRTELGELEIPLPPLTEQKRIASLLARADRLRQLRRTAHDLGDALLQSVFLEMFGKVRGKTKEVLLGETADIASGVTKGQNYNGRKTVEVPYLRVANVQDGYLDLSVIKTIQALPSEIEELRLKPGDVVMTEGGDFDKLGRGAIWRGEIENCIHQNHIFRVRLDTSKVIPEFFENYLLSPKAKDYFLMASKQTTNLASINMTQLKQLPVPLYPLSLQEEFAGVVARVESLRGRMGESTRQVEGLFEALLSESFQN
ncbi:MAG: restriction endonuclease subunit S [Chloroflexi bacterium]|nr:restriction endonuclease subunit S [Chloroflexota bacterium]